MKSKVFFAEARAHGWRSSLPDKMAKLFDEAGFSERIPNKGLIAVKTHFGEKGTHHFVSHIFSRVATDKIRLCGGLPFLSDTNTLYVGNRANAVQHSELAARHGFSLETAGAPLVIADGLRGKNETPVEIGLKHFKTAKIASAFAEADGLVVLSHFKGHIMAGFGGAIKNLAMGCASVAGKREQHSTRQFVVPEKCVGCAQCLEVCPAKAISIKSKKAVIDKKLCIGCGECMSACAAGAIDLDWETDIKEFTERMTEYAFAAAKPFAAKGRAAYFNFLINITPDCDCMPWSDSPIVPDIGVLASKDPVALDKASYDLVKQSSGLQNTALKSGHACGEDKFRGVFPATQPEVQFEYGAQIGLGNKEYELIKL